MIPLLAGKIPKLLFREKIPAMENATPTHCRKYPRKISDEYPGSAMRGKKAPAKAQIEE